MSKHILTTVVICTEQSRQSIQDTLSSMQCDCMVEAILVNSDEKELEISKNLQISYLNCDTLGEALEKTRAHASGKYMHIIEAGDMYYEKSLYRLVEIMESNTIDFMSCSLLENRSLYKIETTYRTYKRTNYTPEKVNHLPIRLKGCIFKTEIVGTFLFSQKPDHSFELAFLAEILNNTQLRCIKALDCVVVYAKKNELIPIKESDCTSDFIEQMERREGFSAVQGYYLINELKKFLVPTSIKYRATNWNASEKDLYIGKMSSLLKKISDDSIANISSVIIAYKNYFFRLKYGHKYEKELAIERKENKYYISFENKQLLNIAASGNFKINILESRKNVLIIDGLEVFQMLGERFELVAVDAKKNIYYPKMYKWTLADKAGFVGESAYEGRRFKFEIPLNSVKQIHFKLRDCHTGEEFELTPTFGAFAKLVKSNKASYYAKDNWIFRCKKNGIAVSVNRKKSLLKSEVKFLYSLLTQKKYNMILLRAVYRVCVLFKKKPLWLIRDNEDRAKDSGAEMFKYYSASQELKEQANAYFILDKKSEDYKKMKKFGKIIQPDSFKYKLYHLLADKLIDTRGGISGKYIFKEDVDYVSDLCDWDYIWLIHGIMTRNESTWTNKYVLNAKLFATCNKRERDSVLDAENGYGYEENEVVLTGLPRHDSLCANKKKKILFLPTWRKHLAGDLIPGTSERSYVNNFKENEYYCFYNSLINHPRLLEVMKEKGYTGDFYLHPSFMKQHEDFQSNEIIHVGSKAADTNQLIGECSLLVTDYSSAQFEGAYLDTPVIYSQYDSETFSDNHTGNEGYFVYEEDGFGPVCCNLEETVDAIISYIEKDCNNQEPYKTRAREFFAHRDHDNSKRVFEHISHMEGIKDKKVRVECDSEYVYLYRGNQLMYSTRLERKESLYNPLLSVRTYLKKVSMKEKSFFIEAGMIINEVGYKLPHYNFNLSIGDYVQKIELQGTGSRKKKKIYRFVAEIPYEEILFTKKSTPLYITWKGEEDCGYCGNIKYCVHKGKGKESKKLHCSKVKILEELGTSIFVRETMGNNAYLCVRDINKTDYPKEQRKLKNAYVLSKLLWFHPGNTSKIFFEKFSSKYEESASVLFEDVIERGERNSYFIIDKESLHYNKIPEKYKKYIIEKYSFRHYLYFFLAKTFISTESMNHSIELNICDANVSLKIGKGEYDYIFLQHGVMYMYCLENRSDFIKGQGFTKNSKVVVSSQTEADHFITYGRFSQSDLIVSGLPKFDRNYRLPNADKILIMPTSRDFEYNVIRLTPTESTYYEFVKKIIACIPEELKDKVIVVGHPLLKDQLMTTDLKKYIPKEYVYNELLQDTKLLITDYSSISYDAFYRGSNVIFCWEDKELCLGAMNYTLMLNEKNAFADISYSFDDLTELIRKNYYGKQEEENIAKYRNIVTYYDNKNTERCYQELVKFGYYGKKKHISIRECKMLNFGSKTYTGDRIVHNNIEVYYKERLLINNRDYKVFYFNNKRQTSYAMAVMIGRGQFYGLFVKRFVICDSIRKCEIEGISCEKGMIDFDKIAVKDRGGRYLRRNKDYKVIIDEPQNGTSILQIKGKGTYGNSIKLRFRGTIISDEEHQTDEENEERDERQYSEE